MSKKKTESREEKKHPFLEAFLFTENGKPKSSLGIYTFCLSIVFLLVYALSYEGSIRLLTGPLSHLPPFFSNLIIAFSASVLGTFLCTLPHRFFRDKRLVFRTYWWLVGYALLVLAAMAVILGFGEGFPAFLTVFGWFAAVPLAMGFIVSFILWRRERPAEEEQAEKEPEWKKYVNPRQ